MRLKKMTAEQHRLRRKLCEVRKQRRYRRQTINAILDSEYQRYTKMMKRKDISHD